MGSTREKGKKGIQEEEMIEEVKGGTCWDLKSGWKFRINMQSRESSLSESGDEF